MSEHHSLGIAGAAGGVLNQRDLIAARCCGMRNVVTVCYFLNQFRDGHDAAKSGNPRLEQSGQLLGLAERNQKACPGVLQNSGLPLSILFQPARLKGRVNRYRYATGQQNSEKSEEEVFTRGKHQ